MMLVDGEPHSLLANVPTSVRVFAADIDPSRSTMTHDSGLSVGRPVGVTLTCRDKFGNNRDGLGTATMRHEQSGTATVRQLDCIDGVGRVSLRSTLSGLHLLSVHVESNGVPTHASASPTHVTLQPGPVDISRTAWVNYNSSTIASEEHEALLQARDEHGNSVHVDDLDIRSRVSPTVGSASSIHVSHEASAISLGSGAYRIPMDLPRAVTRFAVTFSVRDSAGNHESIGPFDLRVMAGPVDLASSVLDPGALRGAVAGQPLALRAQLNDAYGNARTESDHVELTLYDGNGVARTAVQGMTEATDWRASPVMAGGSFEDDYVLYSTGVYTPRFRINQILEYEGLPITVTFGTPGPARVFGWGEVDADTVLAAVGAPEHFFVQSLDSFGNERPVDDLALRVDISTQQSESSPSGCTVSYTADGPGRYKATFQCAAPGAYTMRVSTAAAVEAPALFVAARIDEINTPNGARLTVSLSSSETGGRTPPVWLVRPRWYQSAGPATHARRLQVEIDYAIELELQEEDLSALLADDNANASALDSSLQAQLDARMNAAAALMTGGNFSAMLAESVNEAAAEMAAGCTINADQFTCQQAGCRYAEYPVTAGLSGIEPQSVTLQTPSDLVVEGTVMRIRTPATGATACVIDIPDDDGDDSTPNPGAVVDAADAATGEVTFLAPLSNQIEAPVVLSDCVFTTCETNVTLVALDASDIVNEAPNMTELLANVVVEEPAFSGTATLQGGSLQRVVCGEQETITASVYDSFNNLQTAGSDVFEFRWVSLCLPTPDNAQLVSVVDACAAVDLSGDDGGENACGLVPGCMFSSGTPNPVGSTPEISFNSTTSVYSFDFEIRNCEGAVHFALTVNDVNVTTESGTNLLAPRSIACIPGEISADWTTATERSQAADVGTDAAMAAGQRESIEFTAADLYNNVKLTGGDGGMLAFDITVPAHTSGGQQVAQQTVRCTPDASVDCGMADFNDGRYQAEYQVRYVGMYTVDILVVDISGENSIVNSPLSATVVEGPPVPGLSTLAFSAVSLEVGTEGTVTITRYDAYGNEVPPQNADGAPTGIPQPLAGACTNPGSVATDVCNRFYLLVGEVEGQAADASDPLTLSYSSQASGEIEVTVFFKDESGAVFATGLPGQRTTAVTFTPGQAVLANSVVSDGLQRTVDCIAGADSEFVIQTRDQFQNDCAQTFPTMPSGGLSVCPGPAIACAWTVTLTECLGTTQSEQEACENEGAEASCPQCAVSDNSASPAAPQGQYTVRYNAPSTGYYKVRIQVTNNGGQLDAENNLQGINFGSPFVILSDTSAVASACEVVEITGQNGLVSTRAGEPATFTLQANGIDNDGNPVPRRGSGEQFDISVQGTRMQLDSQSQEYTTGGQGGRYLMTYTASATNYDLPNWPFTVTVMLEGIHIAGSPFSNVEMMPAATAAPYSAATGDALTIGTAGVTEVFQIFARDAFDNAVTDCVADLSSFELQLVANGDAAVAPVLRGCTADPSADPAVFASYEVEYTVTTAAAFSLDIGFLGTPVSGSPHQITIGSSTVSALQSFISVDGQYEYVNGTTPGVPATTGDIATLPAGEVYTFFLHSFDLYSNRLTQNLCAGETGTETVGCLDFAFRWCQLQRDINSVDAVTCHTNAHEGPIGLTKERVEGPGVYRVETAPGADGLSRSGSYRVDVTVTQADGATAALSNSHFLLAVDPAVASAPKTIGEPPLTIMASQTVTFELIARDEFENSVDQLSGGADLAFAADSVCTLASGADCTTAGDGVTTEITYLNSVNRYQVSFAVESGGEAATLQMTIFLGDPAVAANAEPFVIAVRAAQNEPSLCYVFSPEAGTLVQRAAALDVANTAPEKTGRDVLNLDRKIAGVSLDLMIQSVLAAGTDRSFADPSVICTPAELAAEDNTCDRLDEFELVAINTVTQELEGPFREDCADLCANPDPTTGECPEYAGSNCILRGEYGISWSTTIAGDWMVTIRSLGVMIQTEPVCADGGLRDLDSDPPGACVNDPASRPARFDRSNLINTGYLIDDGTTLASFITHVYPAPMSASTSEFELTTLCDASTPCMQMGSEYEVTVVAKDEYGNQLEEETDEGGQPCASAGCLAARVRAYVTTECQDADNDLCEVQASDFVYETDVAYPGHLKATVLPIVAGLAKLRLEFETSPNTWTEFACGKMPAVVLFGVGAPSPNSGFIRAGNDMDVEAAIYGFLQPSTTVLPEFACEWVGASVGGVHRTAATLSDDTRANSVSFDLAVQGGGRGITWVLEQNTNGAWEQVASGGTSPQYVDADGEEKLRYVDTSPCGEDVSVLQAIAAETLADDPRKAATVLWNEADCASALDQLEKYGISCAVSLSSL
jgi:hypothetical protein